MIIAAANGTVRVRESIPVGDVGDPLSLLCIPTIGERYTVRGCRDIPAPAELVAVDHEAPLGQVLRYEVWISGVLLSSLEVTLSATTPLISHPVYGRHVPTVIASWPERSHGRVGQVLEVVDSAAPFIVDGLEPAPTSTLTTITADALDAAALAGLLSSSSLLRVRPSCPHLSTEWVSVRGRRRRFFSNRDDSATVDTLELQHVGMPDPDTPAVGNTLADLHAAYPVKLSDIEAAFPGTLADIAFTDLTL